MAKTPKLHYSEAFEDEHGLGLDGPAYVDDAQGADFDASVCTACGEPLAWHEQACNAVPAPLPDEVIADLPDEVAPDLPTVFMRSSVNYAYGLGHRVRPLPDAPAHPIIWRGQMKERHPATGLVHRVNVYRLGDGFWDCYREDELLAAA